MGAIAEALVAYAQPLLDGTDGSVEQMQKAFTLGNLCYNLALMPESSRDHSIGEMRQMLGMDDKEFDDFRRTVIDPMIQRHQQMFPQFHDQGSTDDSLGGPATSGFPFWKRHGKTKGDEAYPGTDRYAPCPCNSGLKYKFCCGKKRR
jgi:hypothetical protein